MTVVPPNTNQPAQVSAIQPANDQYDSSSSSTLDPIENVDDCIDPAKQLFVGRELPSWVKVQVPQWGERICVPEWDADEAIDDGDAEVGMDNDYRSKNGWKGTDLCHSKTSPVRISHYAVQYQKGGVGTTLTGLVHFTKNAESHAGYCHGGSMTSVMDDVIGWTAFLVTGQCIPWSGFTAQVNVSLKMPIAVGTYLKVVGKIVKCEGRKVWIHSELLLVGDGNDKDDILHCTAEGLVILKR